MNPQGMIEEIEEKYKFSSTKVFSAMLKVPREEFIPEKHRYLAYKDGPVSIGYGQTISQPYTVAFMTHLLDLVGKEKVLEIGTGSGYQAAVLSLLSDKVFTIEIIAQLALEAKKRLKRLGFKNVIVKTGSGELGWKDEAPFDAIVVTAGLDYVPETLIEQLKEGGILVAPVGEGHDKIMTRFKKILGGKVDKKEYGIFHFVPFVESN